MGKEVQWTTDYGKALEQARREKKAVLLDFFNPEWIGCQQMDAVTYPEEKVADFINEKFIALRLPSDTQPHAGNFSVSWTPRIIILDPAGKIHQSTVGFFLPEEFIPALVLGLAKVDFDLECLDGCRKHLDCILGGHPRSSSAPEAVYYLGVTDYKISGKAEPLKEAYKRLLEQYPDSEWVQRASPYRLL